MIIYPTIGILDMLKRYKIRGIATTVIIFISTLLLKNVSAAEIQTDSHISTTEPAIATEIANVPIFENVESIKNEMLSGEAPMVNIMIEEVADTSVDGELAAKSIEGTTVFDIIKDEDVSQELRDRIGDLLNQSQYQVDQYRSAIFGHYKEVDNKLLKFERDLNRMRDFKDDMNANLDLSKWMIISLSAGIICLTTIVIVMWKSVVNVNRNDVEAIFTVEKIRKDLKTLERRVELIEAIYKKNG